MPPIFNSEQFTPELANKIINIALDRNRSSDGYDIMPFRRTRHPNVPRNMGIPHPRAYAELAKCLSDNWDTNLISICQSENSDLNFGLQPPPDNRILVHNYDRSMVDTGLENRDPALAFGRRYKVKTDITNFFHSIYSHSVPWALVGHAQAKQNKSDSGKWFNKIDRAIMLCQRKETRGVPIGPVTSSIISEIILGAVDKEMRGRQHKFTRYIDDYTSYADTRENADKFLTDLTSILESYALSLNLKKTHVTEMPVSGRDKWVADINLCFSPEQREQQSDVEVKKVSASQVRLVLDHALHLSREFPDGSVMKYAVSSILSAGLKDETAELVFHDALLKNSYYFPSLIPLIYKWIKCPKANSEIFRYDDNDRIGKLLAHSIQLEQTDHAVWCMYYMIIEQTFYFDNQNMMAHMCETDTPMLILMGYIFCKKKGIGYTAPAARWAAKKIQQLHACQITEYDIDRFWLVFYQFYLDGVIAAPPYKLASKDNAIFELLKAEGVSFINFSHEDLRAS